MSFSNAVVKVRVVLANPFPTNVSAVANTGTYFTADGDLIVGDSHHSFWSPPPFSREAVDELMLAELRAVLRLPGARVVERWSGTYATLPDHLMIREAPLDGVRLVIVTSGTGASTAFAIAEETLAELFEEELQ